MLLLKPQEAKFIDTARSVIGVPWRHRGVTRTGLDCIGLIIYCAKEAELLAVDFKVESYSTFPRPELMLKELGKIANRSSYVRPGGVLLFHRQNLVHLAIVSGYDTIIHADRDHGAVVEVPRTAPWDRYNYSFWEFK